MHLRRRAGDPDAKGGVTASRTTGYGERTQSVRSERASGTEGKRSCPPTRTSAIACVAIAAPQRAYADDLPTVVAGAIRKAEA